MSLYFVFESLFILYIHEYTIFEQSQKEITSLELEKYASVCKIKPHSQLYVYTWLAYEHIVL